MTRMSIISLKKSVNGLTMKLSVQYSMETRKAGEVFEDLHRIQLVSDVKH